jgi:hypothetical protein
MYVGYPGEDATISGGRKITGWSGGGGVNTASTGGLSFRQLFVNDKAAIKARSGGGGSGSALEEIHITGGGWGETYLPMNSGGGIVSRAAANYEALGNLNGVLPGDVIGYRNSPSFINGPGQFAVDGNTVYYMPRDGEDMSSVEAVAGVLDPVVKIKGSSLDKMAGNIIFQELSFAHTTWSGYDSAGFCSIQSGHGVFTDGKGGIALGRVSSGVTMENSHHIRFEKCEFKCMGGGGVDFLLACHDNAVTGCTIRDIGANGVAVAPVGATGIGGDTTGAFNPDDERLLCKNIEVSQNMVTACAYEFKGCVGIFAGYPTDFKLLHNSVLDLPYTGISVGWGWNPDTNNAMRRNICRANLVQDCMRDLIDGGLFYMLSGAPGTIVDSNLLVYRIEARGNFFYLDVGCNGYTVKHNASIGISFMFGMGFDCYNLVIDSNYSQWSNAWTSNGTVPNESTYNVQFTNMFIEDAPEGIVNNAGVHGDIALTPVPVKPGGHSSRIPVIAHGDQVFQVFNIKGQRVFQLKGDIGKVIPGSKKVLPAGTYIIRQTGNKNPALGKMFTIAK